MMGEVYLFFQRGGLQSTLRPPPPSLTTPTHTHRTHRRPLSPGSHPAQGDAGGGVKTREREGGQKGEREPVTNLLLPGAPSCLFFPLSRLFSSPQSPRTSSTRSCTRSRAAAVCVCARACVVGVGRVNRQGARVRARLGTQKKTPSLSLPLPLSLTDDRHRQQAHPAQHARQPLGGGGAGRGAGPAGGARVGGEGVVGGEVHEEEGAGGGGRKESRECVSPHSEVFFSPLSLSVGVGPLPSLSPHARRHPAHTHTRHHHSAA
jgi:hypothetical protein